MLWLRWESWPAKAKDRKNWVSGQFTAEWRHGPEPAPSAGVEADLGCWWGYPDRCGAGPASREWYKCLFTVNVAYKKAVILSVRI